MKQKGEIPLCQYHQKKLKILCTNPPCRKPRLSCTKCLYDESRHSSCITKTILLDDLEANKFTEKLKNWVESELDRKRLNEIAEVIVPRMETNLKIILKKLDELKNAIFEEIEGFFKELKEKVKANEGIKLFHSHFSIEKLNSMVSEQKIDGLNSFFSVNSKDFLRVFDNTENNRPLAFDSSLISKVFKEKTEEIREILPDFLNTKLQFPVFFPKTPLVPLLKMGNPIHKVNRFRKHEGSIWSYDRKYPDYITFEANRNIRVFGFGIYKTRVLTQKWKILGQIIEGPESSGKVLQRKDFVVSNSIENSGEFIGKLLFEPIDLAANNSLTLYIWVDGPDTLGGLEGMQTVKNEKDKIEFRFMNTKTKETDNGTTIKVGQIPELFYSILGE